MAFERAPKKKDNALETYPRSIIFQERYQERIFNAENDDVLAESCLVVLRERHDNPAWGYKPALKDISEEEQEFIDFLNTDYNFLPILMQKMAESIKRRIEARIDTTSDPDWTWYTSVENLLALPTKQATGYKIPYKGRYIPTSYYLLLQRRHHPHEGFVIVDNMK